MTVEPVGLFDGGTALWTGVIALHDLDDAQLATLEQACRQRDRADALADKASTGDASALRNEREAGLAMTRLLAALRLLTRCLAGALQISWSRIHSTRNGNRSCPPRSQLA